jgi:N-acetyl-1-D-myo-inositol-2-amino-2-deoxy-alpha-D-glucopyranoside deacetylase
LAADGGRNPLIDPRPGDVVLFLHAHPDDESLFTGGTIARLARAGASVVLVTATMGELGTCRDPRDRPDAAERAALARRRRVELELACEVLGVGCHLFLGSPRRWTDSGIDRDGHAPDALVANAGAAVEDLMDALRRIRPHTVVTYAADGGTRHPDHIACHRIAVAAARKRLALDGIGTGMHLIVTATDGVAPPADDGTLSIDIEQHVTTKVRAIGCHRSQAMSVSVQRYVRELLAREPWATVERYRAIPV